MVILKFGKDVFMNNVFHLTTHALNRMQTRNISNSQVAKTLFCGNIYAAKGGLHRAKFKEGSGKFIDEYIVIFSKQSSRVVTVEHRVIRNDQSDGEFISRQQLRKRYKQRKRAINRAEFDTYCREEFSNWNVRFSA